MTVFDPWMNLVPKTSWNLRKGLKERRLLIMYMKVSNLIKLLNLYKTRSGHLIDRWTSLEHAWLAMIEYIH